MGFLLGVFSLDAGAEGPPAFCPPIDPPAIAPSLRIFIDPETGRRRPPTAEERRQMAEERLQTRRAKVSALVLETHAGGMKSVDLGDAFLMDVVMEKRADGTTSIQCLPGAHAPAAGEVKP
jgi:hypothetical protein